MATWSYSDHGSSGLLTIRSIEVWPEPLQTPCEMKMLIKGTANEQIENGAYLKVTVKYGLIKLRNETCDLFKKLSDGAASQDNWTLALVQGDASKPIPKGEVQLVSTMKLTERTPKVEFTVSVSGYTVDDYSLLDLHFTFDNR